MAFVKKWFGYSDTSGGNNTNNTNEPPPSTGVLLKKCQVELKKLKKQSTTLTTQAKHAYTKKKEQGLSDVQAQQAALPLLKKRGVVEKKIRAVNVKIENLRAIDNAQRETETNVTYVKALQQGGKSVNTAADQLEQFDVDGVMMDATDSIQRADQLNDILDQSISYSGGIEDDQGDGEVQTLFGQWAQEQSMQQEFDELASLETPPSGVTPVGINNNNNNRMSVSNQTTTPSVADQSLM